MKTARAVLFVGLMIAPMVRVGADAPVTLKVSPLVSFAPTTIVIRTRIKADVANRALEIAAESDDFYRSSVVGLDGADAPTSNVFQFRDLPGGEYEVTATLYGQDGSARSVATQMVNVIGTSQ
jgi:hypothetical protein